LLSPLRSSKRRILVSARRAVMPNHRMRLALHAHRLRSMFRLS
jgi:hypothetical protein